MKTLGRLEKGVPNQSVLAFSKDRPGARLYWAFSRRAACCLVRVQSKSPSLDNRFLCDRGSHPPPRKDLLEVVYPSPGLVRRKAIRQPLLKLSGHSRLIQVSSTVQGNLPFGWSRASPLSTTQRGICFSRPIRFWIDAQASRVHSLPA